MQYMVVSDMRVVFHVFLPDLQSLALDARHISCRPSTCDSEFSWTLTVHISQQITRPTKVAGFSQVWRSGDFVGNENLASAYKDMQ